MIMAADLKAGMVIKLDAELYRLISAEFHAGAGKFGSMMHARGKCLHTHHIKEWRFHPGDKIEDVHLERQVMEYLYSEGGNFYFMDPNTFEQISLPKEAIGPRERFLQPNMRIPIEFYKEQPVNVAFPETVGLKVTSAPPGLHGHETATYKAVILENGMEVLVPQFIMAGDIVRIEVETGKYVERVRHEGKNV
jgi:elongation factor P